MDRARRRAVFLAGGLGGGGVRARRRAVFLAGGLGGGGVRARRRAVFLAGGLGGGGVRAPTTSFVIVSETTADHAPAGTDLPPGDTDIMAETFGIAIFVDADACPVKAEVFRVAERHKLKTFVVANSPIAVPRDAAIERVVVASGPDEADNWIAERAGRGAVVITADIPLASRCVKAGADVIAPNGRAFTEASIGMALATRNLLDELRGAGAVTGGPKPFSPRDRSEFLQALDRAIVRLKRAGLGPAPFGRPA